MTEPWDGKPHRDGWHWLNRKRDGQPRMAYHERAVAFWRVADTSGRTVIMSEGKTARLYEHCRHVEPPGNGAI